MNFKPKGAARRRLQEESFSYRGSNFSISVTSGGSLLVDPRTCVDKVEAKYKTAPLFYFYQFATNSAASSKIQAGFMKVNEDPILLIKAEINEKMINLTEVCSPRDVTVRFSNSYVNLISGATVNLLNSVTVNPFDILDKFFNNKCVTYEEDGKDITLGERTKYQMDNEKVCNSTGDQVCSVVANDLNEEADCRCHGIGSNDKSDIVLKAISFDNFNYYVFLCWNETLDGSTIYTNVGFWCMIAIVVAFSIWALWSLREYRSLIYTDKIYEVIRNDCKLYEEGTPVEDFLKKVETRNKHGCLEISDENPSNSKENNSKQSKILNPEEIQISERSDTSHKLNKAKEEKSEENSANKAEVERVGITLRDIYAMEIPDQRKYDDRPFKQYFKDFIFHKHDQFPLALMNSLLNPRIIRILVLLTSLTLKFALNAFFYDDDYIQKRNESLKSDLMFTLVNEIWKTVLSSVISVLLTTVFYSFLTIPDEEKEEFTRNIKTLDRDLICQA